MSAATLRPLLERLLERGDLDAAQAEAALHALADPALPPAMEAILSSSANRVPGRRRA